MGKRLNLKWVSDEIGDTYKDWKYGDIVTINAQTGTGKTYFITGNDKNKGLIDNIGINEKVLYLCNRLELKNQIKKDLMKKYNMDIPYLKDENGNYLLNKKGKKILDLDQLEKIIRIKNITIISYHQLASNLLDREYIGKEFNLDVFQYIICDECHYFLTDASFNNKTYIAFKELVETKHINTIKIFISATMDEMEAGIDKYLADIKIHKYSTGIDYSYLNVKYFNDIENIAATIKNDATDEKWLVFISNKKQGAKLKEILDEYDISNSFITANSKTEESLNITQDCEFNCKVLISTKCLDNGVNIKDENLKNLVVIAIDKTTFIQEIGRARFDIEKAPIINLYINKAYKKTFATRYKRVYKPKKEDIELFNNNINAFKRKYNNDQNKIPGDIFYQDTNNEWKINDAGIVRLDRDIGFAVKMELRFESDEWAFVKEQLKWLGLEDTFDELNFIGDVIDNNEVVTLVDYLKSIVGKRLYKEEQEELSKFIIAELTTISKGTDYRTKVLKPSTLENILREQLELEFAVSKPKREDRKVDGKRITKSYIEISEI